MWGRKLIIGNKPPALQKPKRIPVPIPPGHWIQGWKDVLAILGLATMLGFIIAGWAQCTQSCGASSAKKDVDLAPYRQKCIEAGKDIGDCIRAF